MRGERAAAARPSPAAPPQGPQAGGEHPVLHRAPGLLGAHRLLLALPVLRGPPGPHEEEERQEGPGRATAGDEEEEDARAVPRAGAAARVPQIIKQDIHTVGKKKINQG